MRYLWIAAALLLLLTLVPTHAEAAGPGQGIQIVNNNYISNNNHSTGRSGYQGGYYDRGYPSSRGGYGYQGRGYGSHSEAVARIRAKHSRYRYTVHPRSNYNSPPFYEGPRRYGDY